MWIGECCCAMEGVKGSQTFSVTREVWRENLDSSGLVRRRKDGSELEVEERSIREAMNFDKVSLSKLGVEYLGKTGMND